MKDTDLLEEFLNSVAPEGGKNQKLITRLKLLIAFLNTLSNFNKCCIDDVICDHIKILNQLEKIKEEIIYDCSLTTDYKKYIVNKKDLIRLNKIEKKITEFSGGIDKEHLNIYCVEFLIEVLSQDGDMNLEQAIAIYDNNNKV